MTGKPNPNAEATTVRSVERAADLLEALISSNKPISLAELSDTVDLHPSTAHRLLATLDKRKFVYQDPASKLYTIGPKLMIPSHGYRSTQYLRNLAMPILQKVSNELGESASLAIRQGNQAMLVAQASSDRRVNVTIQPEALAPLHCTGVGKAILSQLDSLEVRQIINETGFTPNTPYTITDLDTLILALTEIKQSGYATDREEWEVGIRCIAVPFASKDGGVIGAISVSAPAGRVSADDETRYAEVIKKYLMKFVEQIG